MEGTFRMKKNLKLLFICLSVPLFIGMLSGILSGGGMEQFNELNKPAFSPPGFIFPIVWTVLYILMGLSSYLVLTSDAPLPVRNRAMLAYAVQLIVNFFWSPIFFGLEAYLFAFFWLILLWLLIIVMIYQFWKISKPAALINIPYLIWVAFAGYLNLMVFILNPT
jgi:tryptophan-rich sensory protein